MTGPRGFGKQGDTFFQGFLDHIGRGLHLEQSQILHAFRVRNITLAKSQEPQLLIVDVPRLFFFTTLLSHGWFPLSIRFPEAHSPYQPAGPELLTSNSPMPARLLNRTLSSAFVATRQPSWPVRLKVLMVWAYF